MVAREVGLVQSLLDEEKKQALVRRKVVFRVGIVEAAE
jgi:hypothetical protein